MGTYDELKYPALKKECNTRGLSMIGKAVNLRERLKEYDAVAQTPQGMAKLVKDTKPGPLPTDPDPNHPGFPNWDYMGRWIRR